MNSVPSKRLPRVKALKWLNAQVRPRAGRTLVAIDGVDGSGKTCFADDLADLVRESGTKVIRISFDNFLNPAAVRHAKGRTSAEGYFEDSYNYQRFIDDVLEPLGHGGSGRFRRESYSLSTEASLNPPWEVAPDHAVVIVDGMFLHRDELRNVRGKKIWDLSVWLDVPFAVSVARLSALVGRPADPDDPANHRYVKGQELYIEKCDPASRADVVVENEGERSVPE